ncbi:MAG TPA: transcription elongation factor GreA [Thermomicrobiales bacterium]|jgi:transcription elongation factor GreA|nr:transcription elongation factor GreA [Thermomicrobiales bacterium]
MQSDPVPVTREGLERLKAELEELKNVRRPEIAEIVAEARSHGDLRENSAYDAARHDQMMNERRIADLDALFRNAVIVDDLPTTKGAVGLGSTVTIDFDGEEEQYTIVGAIESKPTEGKISNVSPIGAALLGKRPGQTAKVPTPAGSTTVKILRVE